MNTELTEKIRAIDKEMADIVRSIQASMPKIDYAEYAKLAEHFAHINKQTEELRRSLQPIIDMQQEQKKYAEQIANSISEILKTQAPMLSGSALLGNYKEGHK